MRFRFEHAFDAPVEKVEQTMLSESFLRELASRMTTVKEIEALEIDDQGGVVRRRVRYRLHPIIEKVGPKRVPPEAFEWVEESEYDRSSRTMRFRNIPTHHRVKPVFLNEGTVTLTEKGGKTVRTLEGELKIKVPLIGKMVERVVHSRAAQILEEEARILESLLKE